jgi:hypothetical protein
MLKAAASKRFMKNSIPGDESPGILSVCKVAFGSWQVLTYWIRWIKNIGFKDLRSQGFKGKEFYRNSLLCLSKIVYIPRKTIDNI